MNNSRLSVTSAPRERLSPSLPPQRAQAGNYAEIVSLALPTFS